MEKQMFVLGAAVLFAGCILGVDGNGERVTETRALAGFSAVEADGSLDVQIRRGDTFNVQVSIDSNLLRAVRTDLVDGGATLWIDVSEPIGDTVAGPHIIVTMPVLRHVGLRGSGAVDAAGFEQAEPVALALDGSGLLGFAGYVPSIQVRSSGSGDVTVHGSAGALDARLEGSGAVDARSCPVTTADLALDGSGDLAANVSDSVRVSLSGSGHVVLFGPAALESVTISGSGSITRR